ncbi:hypothetical protein QE152_g23046 [Popillia japonica]|uniref:Uncharacterized protein n=1 Tax=Popillia japonica TaxID=7064 RepID=A0AAW1KIM5_POPJA
MISPGIDTGSRGYAPADNIQHSIKSWRYKIIESIQFEDVRGCIIRSLIIMLQLGAGKPQVRRKTTLIEPARYPLTVYPYQVQRDIARPQ